MRDKEILEKVLEDMGIPVVKTDKPSPIYIDGVPAGEWFDSHPHWFEPCEEDYL